MKQTLELPKDKTDVVRGMACILIVLHHFCAKLMGMRYSNFLIDLIGLRGGVTGVTIFFFLSGWGLSESQLRHHYDAWTFAKKRLIRVFIPLVFTNLIYYPIILWSQGRSFNLTDFILNILNIHPIDGVTWYCNVLILFYALFYISFLFKKKGHIAICITILTVIYAIYSTYTNPDSPFKVYSLIGFPMGVIFSLYKNQISNKFFMASICSVLPVLLILSILFPNYSNLFIANLYSWAVILALVVLITKFSLKSSTFLFLGKYSYEIYLLHFKALVILSVFGLALWYPLVFIGIVIPLSIVVNKLLAKIY